MASRNLTSISIATQCPRREESRFMAQIVKLNEAMIIKNVSTASIFPKRTWKMLSAVI